MKMLMLRNTWQRKPQTQVVPNKKKQNEKRMCRKSKSSNHKGDFGLGFFSNFLSKKYE